MTSLFPPDEHFDKTRNASAPFTDEHFESLDSWEKIRVKLREIIPAADYERWISKLQSRQTDRNEITLIFPDMQVYQKVIDEYLDRFEYCKMSLGLDILFRYEVSSDEPTTADQEPQTEVFLNTTNHQQASQSASPGEVSTPVSRALSSQSHLNPEYRFDNFVNGPSNQFAHASCLAVADDPGQTYNPLFLYGSTGLGKTHLLHAVGNAALSRNRDIVVTYISSERFMNEMIYCLRFNKMWDFRRKYRNSDILLVDDIQFISGKERTQEEFFHTFNALYEIKKQIIVTSDVFPQDIPDIEERLRNRFQWGLIADIQPPDVEHRVAILMTKAEKQNLNLTAEAAQYIANHAKGSVRTLEGALKRVAAHASLQGRPLDLTLATEVLQFVFSKPQKQLTVEAIQKIVSEYFKIRISDMKSKKRQRAFSVPRQIAMYLARSRTNCSFPEIGAKFGGKDHTTVMHAVKKIESERKNDLDLRSNIEALDRKLDQMT